MWPISVLTDFVLWLTFDSPETCAMTAIFAASSPEVAADRAKYKGGYLMPVRGKAVLSSSVNLALDGATNAGQDEIFARYKVTGQQMMFWINVMCTLLTSTLCILPLPYIPVLHPSHGSQSEFSVALEFIRQHPSIIVPLAQFAFTGSLGQLFIFETLQHFGSLTLVYVNNPSALCVIEKSDQCDCTGPSRSLENSLR